MTTHHREVTAIVPDELYKQVEEAVEDLDTDDATRLAIGLGIDPPDDDPDWMLCPKYDPDGVPAGLVWVLAADSH